MKSAEVLEREVRVLREMLTDATRFLDSIESRIGNTAFLDMMPNNCHGRAQFRAALGVTKTQPTPADRGTARAIIAHMEQPIPCRYCGKIWSSLYPVAIAVNQIAEPKPDTLTCEDYDPDAAMGEDYITGESMPLSLITREQGGHVRTLEVK
jgi:hypothetical protein